MLNGAQGVVITGGLFVANADNSSTYVLPIVPEGALDRLIDEVAPNAILNADGRADEVRCFPGTREEVIGQVEKWIDGKGSRRSRMMWLTGPAGAGKSAISQTVAERCRERGIHTTNFFFFRGDRTRNHAQPLVATLVYQLRRFHALDQLLTDCLAADPLICRAPIEEQFTQLIFCPIHTVQHLSPQPIILIIDGLDECNDGRKQEQILVALHALTQANQSPFLVLVVSRAEPHLIMAFNKLGNLVESIFLDDKYRPQDDIRHFVAAKFLEIKRVHHLGHALENNWPAETDIDAITDKSSGQFIYAATVMRFIQYSPANPALSLLTVHGLQPSVNHSPFAQLDAVYSYIFSRAHDIKVVKLCLGAHFIIQSVPVISDLLYGKLIVGALRKDKAIIEIESSFADLAAIVKVADVHRMDLVFYHASLSDFLKDESRSRIYHIDEGETAIELSLICLKNFGGPDSLSLAVSVLRHVKETTPELSKSLLDASTQQCDKSRGNRGTQS